MDALSNYVITREATVSLAFVNETYKIAYVAVPTVSGYKPIAVSGYRVSNVDYYLIQYGFANNYTEVFAYIVHRAKTSATINLSVIVTVLYIRDI